MPMCMPKGKCAGHMTSYYLVMVGALNWGLVGLGMFFDGNWNLVNLIFGSVSWLESLVYVLVGLAAVMMLVGCKCKKCKSSGGGCCGGDDKPKEEM